MFVWNPLRKMSFGRNGTKIERERKKKRAVGQIKIKNSGLIGRALPQAETVPLGGGLSCLAEGGGPDADVYRDQLLLNCFMQIFRE